MMMIGSGRGCVVGGDDDDSRLGCQFSAGGGGGGGSDVTSTKGLTWQPGCQVVKQSCGPQGSKVNRYPVRGSQVSR